MTMIFTVQHCIHYKKILGLNIQNQIGLKMVKVIYHFVSIVTQNNGSNYEALIV